MASTIEAVLAIEDPTQFAIALADLVYGGSRGFDDLRPAERVVWCLDQLETEVNNGGFWQFFANSAGDHARESLEALRAIGAAHTAGLLERAIAVFPGGGPSPSRDLREHQVDALSGEHYALWETLDEAFYRHEDDLTSLLRAYLTRHTDDFR